MNWSTVKDSDFGGAGTIMAVAQNPPFGTNKGQPRWLNQGQPLTSDQRALGRGSEVARALHKTARNFASNMARMLVLSLRAESKVKRR